jgi:hypothetical protein
MRKMVKPLVWSSILILGLLVMDREARAQYYSYGYGPRPNAPMGYSSPYQFRHRPHVYLGADAMVMAIVGQKVDDIGKMGPGGGLGLFGGFRFGPWASLELNWTFTFHDESFDGPTRTTVIIDNLQLQTLTGDFKLHIPTWGIFEPFIQAGAGIAFIGLTGDWNYDGYIFNSGPTFTLGGGGEFWLGSWLSVGGRILYRGMYFGEHEYRHGSSTSTAKNYDDDFISGLDIGGFVSFHF